MKDDAQCCTSKLILTRVANDLSDSLIFEPYRIDHIVGLLLPRRSNYLVAG